MIEDAIKPSQTRNSRGWPNTARAGFQAIILLPTLKLHSFSRFDESFSSDPSKHLSVKSRRSLSKLLHIECYHPFAPEVQAALRLLGVLAHKYVALPLRGLIIMPLIVTLQVPHLGQSKLATSGVYLKFVVPEKFATTTLESFAVLEYEAQYVVVSL